MLSSKVPLLASGPASLPPGVQALHTKIAPGPPEKNSFCLVPLSLLNGKSSKLVVPLFHTLGFYVFYKNSVSFSSELPLVG